MTAGRRACFALFLALILASGGEPVQAGQRGEVVVTADEPLAFQGPSLAIDPVRPRRLVVSFQEGFNLKTCYLALSEDGGGSWRTVALAGRGSAFPLRERDLCWNPMLSYGPDGTLYYVFQNSFLTREGGREVMIMVSRDGGKTFAPPRPVLPQPGVSQNWPRIAVDQRTARVYLSWTSLPPDPPTGPHAALPPSGTVQVSSSPAGAKMFSEPTEPNVLHSVSAWASQVAVGPDGRLYLAYSTHSPDLEHDPSSFALVFGSSRDEGKTFQTKTIGNLYPLTADSDPLAPAGTFRGFSLAAGNAPGDVYVAWWRRTPHHARIFFSASKDGGARWTPPRVVGVPPGADDHHQHRPWFAVEPGGRMHLVYYDRDGLEGPQHVYSTYSDDGGQSFSSPARITGVASDSRVGPAGQGSEGYASFGDFPAAAPSRNGLMAAWTDSRRGTLLDAKQDIFATRPGTPARASARVFRLTVKPRRAHTGARTRLGFGVTTRRGGRRRPVRGARIRLAGRRLRTDRHGRARVVLRFTRAGRYPVEAKKTGYRRVRIWLRVSRGERLARQDTLQYRRSRGTGQGP